MQELIGSLDADPLFEPTCSKEPLALVLWLRAQDLKDPIHRVNEISAKT